LERGLYRWKWERGLIRADFQVIPSSSLSIGKYAARRDGPASDHWRMGVRRVGMGGDHRRILPTPFVEH